MRAVACALAALSFLIAGPAAAQSFGPSGGPPSDGYQSGPPPYFTDRPSNRGPEQGFDRPPGRNPDQGFDRPPNRGPEQGFDRPPPQRGGQDGPWPPVTRNAPPSRPDERAVETRPRPPVENRPPIETRPPVTTYRRVEPGQGQEPSPELSARPGDNRGERRVIVTPGQPPRGPAPRERYGDRGSEGSGSRVMIGPNEIVISITEYEELKNQARELQRLRGSRSDGRDYRPGSGPTYR